MLHVLRVNNAASILKHCPLKQSQFVSTHFRNVDFFGLSILQIKHIPRENFIWGEDIITILDLLCIKQTNTSLSSNELDLLIEVLV